MWREVGVHASALRGALSFYPPLPPICKLWVAGIGLWAVAFAMATALVMGVGACTTNAKVVPFPF